MTTTINTNLSSSAVSADSLSVNGKPRPAHFSIMSLIDEIIKIEDKLRDTQYQYSIEQQLNAYTESMDSYDKQKDAAEKHKKQSLFGAAGSFMTAGVTASLTGLERFAKDGFHRAPRNDRTNSLTAFHNSMATGDHVAAEKAKSEFFTMSRSEGRKYDLLDGTRHRVLGHVSGNPEVYGRLGEAGMSIGGSQAAMGASSDERLSELDKTVEKYFDKDADSYAQKARSVSSEMRQAISALVQIEGKLSDAINIR